MTRSETSTPLGRTIIRSVPDRLLYRMLARPLLSRYLSAADRLVAWRRLGLQCDPYCYMDASTRILFNPSNITVGYGSNVAERCELHAWEPIVIGRCVFISAGSILLTGSHDIDSPDFAGDRAPITVGDYAWIALGALILPGVTIGEGAVVGAHAVVSRDVPPYTVVAGNPARIVRERARQQFTYIPADWKRNRAWQRQVGIGV